MIAELALDGCVHLNYMYVRGHEPFNHHETYYVYIMYTPSIQQYLVG